MFGLTRREQRWKAEQKAAAARKAPTPELSRAAVTPGAARQRIGVGLNELLCR